jgi:osmotically-inducible protein OsmY
MKTDEVLQKEVQDALKWEPQLHPGEIGVIVKKGIVTLTGNLESYAKKSEAEHAAKMVAGVKAVVDEIDVVIGRNHFVSDNDIAADAVRMLSGSLVFDKHAVKVVVEDGWVTLDGQLQWDFQRDMARRAVKDLPGVKGVINNIKLKKELHDSIEKGLIEDALRRHWAIDADEIDVKATGSTVTLSGYVRSIYQREEAEKIAYKTPGVLKVINKLEVCTEQPYLC